MSVSEETVKNYGLRALPAAAKAVLPGSPEAPQPFPVSSTPVPKTALAQRIQAYAKEKLPRQTFNHSMRVYHFGLAIARQHFPKWDMAPGGKLEETFFLCALLHDIATTDEARAATVMSFELHGGIIALDVLQHSDHGLHPAHGNDSSVAPKAQAESVAESIVRHQDVEERGRVSTLTQLIQLATIFDNAGQFAEYVHKDTIKDVNETYPREKWLDCFGTTIKKEMAEKPWCTTTRLGVEEFPNMVYGNDLMKPYE